MKKKRTQAEAAQMAATLKRISLTVEDYFHAPDGETVADGVEAMFEALGEATQAAAEGVKESDNLRARLAEAQAQADRLNHKRHEEMLAAGELLKERDALRANVAGVAKELTDLVAEVVPCECECQHAMNLATEVAEYAASLAPDENPERAKERVHFPGCVLGNHGGDVACATTATAAEDRPPTKCLYVSLPMAEGCGAVNMAAKEVARLKAELAHMTGERDACHRDATSAEKEIERLRKELARAVSERNAERANAALCGKETEAALAKRDALKADLARATAERDAGLKREAMCMEQAKERAK